MSDGTEQDIIETLVAGRYHVPELGGPLRSPFRHLAIERSFAGREAELVAALELGDSPVIVADQNTVDIMGRRLARALGGAGMIVLDRPKADEETAALLEERTRHADSLIAVGSGTLNDLCKYVGHRTGRPCAVFGTAPSMDGYVTSTVSITRQGFKLTLPAQAPRGVFLELETMAAAPRAMILAGFGDTICRTVCQVDWLLSHLLLDTVYAQTPYDLMAADEERLYAHAAGLPKGELEAVTLLVRLLVLSGMGVLVTGTSHCGSMGEHQISHYLDMFLHPHPRTLHGQQVGVATWTMARLQDRMLASKTPPELRPLSVEEAELARLHGSFAAQCATAMRAKPYDAEGTARSNDRLAERWPAIRERLTGVMLPLQRMAALIDVSGMPKSAASLGIEAAFYRQAVGHAHQIRDRYGFLDLAAQAGELDAFAAGEG